MLDRRTIGEEITLAPPHTNRDVPHWHGLALFIRLAGDEGHLRPVPQIIRRLARCRVGGQAVSGRLWIAAAKAGLMRALMAQLMAPAGPFGRSGLRRHVTTSCA